MHVFLNQKKNKKSHRKTMLAKEDSHTIHGTGIFTYIYHENQPNVGKYTIHGWYGIELTMLTYTQILEKRIEQIQRFAKWRVHH